jgi:DNA-binding NtrC family response regulator
MSMSNPTILVVDDEAQQRNWMSDILDLDAYTVLEASDYDDALAVQANHPGEIDLLLIDVILPGGNGYNLGTAMLAIEPHLKVLFISGHAGAELCKFFDMPLPDVHFLQKPFEPADLRRRVKSTLASADPWAGNAMAG